MNKKVVWLPYDFDTALGINNEGALVFSYNLEDTDHLAGGADVFNGQESVVWVNLREAFGDEIKAMYQQLRSDGELSYEVVEQMFEAHQDKWSEAIFNEDSYFKYLAPLVAPDAGKEPTAAYLAMLQGSKKEQRKWWMYNRFRYMDSKYNAGDALSDVIQLRGYAKANVTVTPYADVYASVKYGSYLVQQRAERNVPVTLVCPLDKVNDTEIYIYSASQLADIGDISGLQVGFADFSMGTKLQMLKVGDSASGFSNANLKELYLGNNALLKTLDVRNCVALGTDTQKTVDISGCTNIENVYFDGTAIQGLTLPNGGVLKVLHLPSTITNLTIMNQLGITDLTIPSYSNVSTLRLENTNVNSKAILMATPSSARVRIIGFAWEAQDATEIEAILDKLDTMRGLDETGGNVDKAQVSGTIHTSALTGAEIAEFNARYPFVTVSADHISCQLNYYSWDGQTLLESETVLDGGDGTWGGTPARPSTAQYTYAFVGWNTAQDASVADANATKAVTTDRNIYAAYSRELRHYTATFVRASADGGGTLYTQTNVPYGTTPTYSGATPTTTRGSATDYPFEGWTPALSGITGDTTYTAKFGSPVEDVEITDSWDTILASIEDGTYRTKYKVGNYKPLDLGTEGTLNMQIVAFDTDVTPSGNTVPTTWISKELLASQHIWNPSYSAGVEGTGTIGGYEKSEINSYMHNTILPLIPSNVAGQIKAVSKTHSAYDTSGQRFSQTSNLSVWIPSQYEIFGAYSIETAGIRYDGIYKNDSTRKKYSGTSADYWALRSAQSVETIYRVKDSGKRDYYSTGSRFHRYPLCFCLGTSEIDDSWSDIIASTSDGTYTKYKEGDWKSLDLGTLGTVKMEIVGIDVDDLADGSGKGPLSFLSKELLAQTHRWNPPKSGTTEGTGTFGGYEKSEIRTWMESDVWDAIPTEVRNFIVPVVKKHASFDTSQTSVLQTTNLSVWIPSRYEMFGTEAISGEAGVRYSKFSNGSSRAKRIVGASSGTDWWLHSVGSGSSTYARCVRNDGYDTSNNIMQAFGVPLGFCIKSSQS